MDQRKYSSFVSIAPSSSFARRPRRRARAGRNGLMLMAASIGILGGLTVTRGLARQGAPSRVAATRVDAAARPKSRLVNSAPVASRLAAPPFSWDYRWLEAHPATGAPANRAHAAVMVDLESGHVLYSRNPHQRMASASTAKLMTAMVTLDAADPSTVVTVPPAAIQVEPNVMGLSAGEKLTVQDVLTGLLLDSGNDAAETLAVTTVGDRVAFITAMNAKAAAMALTDTHFANPSGLDDPAQYTSPHDLAMLAAYLYRHYPLLERIVTTKTGSIQGSSDHKAFAPINLNKLLWSYPGAIGFKTGLTDNAGTCLVAGARRGAHTLVLVELNDPLIFTDAAPLFDYGFRRAG
ncbi:MAG: D-alanyl-D-alanine carboxypeptidase family protein [Candidatus Dormibacteria bacterium]